MQAGGVHHHEHGSQALVGLAHQPCLGTLEAHGAGGAALDAHLLFDAVAVNGVGQEPAAVLRNAARRQEQRQPARACGSIGQARQHQVHDVLAHVLVAARDEDLAAVQAVAAIAPGPGLAAQQAQVGAGLGLGQVHGAGPLAGHQLLEIGGLELIAAGRQQGLDGAVGQQRAQRKAQVGAVEHFHTGRANRLGQALAAKILRMLQALPAAFGVLAKGLLEARRGGDHAVLEAGRRHVAQQVQRCHHAFAQLGAFLQHGLGRLQASLLETGQLRHLVDLRQMLHGEQHVFEGSRVSHC